MIRFTADNGEMLCIAELKGRIGVYLDNDSLYELAVTKGRELRRQRFVDALRRGGTLLFSFTNALEVAGLMGQSASAVRAFLDSVGSYWVPLKMNPFKVIEMEELGLSDQAPISEEFMKGYVEERAYDLSLQGRKLLDLSTETFFCLGAVLDWMQENRDSIRDNTRRIEGLLRDQLIRFRDDYEKDCTSLDRQLPPVPFDSRKPATFVATHLLRKLVIESKAFQFKDGDGPDFCHAVLAAAYGSIVTLDKQWKRRVENLPTPNRLAKVYYRPEVDQLVDMVESLVTSK